MKVKVTLGILSGVVAGLVIGILFAPDRGSETRRKIAVKSGELSHDIKNKLFQFGEFVSEKLDSTKGVYNQFIRIKKASA